MVKPAESTFQVLVLEPEPPIRYLLRRNIEARNLPVLPAKNFRQARMQLIRHSPNLIIMEPAIDHGSDFLRILCQNQISTPLIFMSYLSADMLPRQYLLPNLIATFPKPFDLERLLVLCSFVAHSQKH